MKKALNINAGSALLLNDRLEAFSGYESVHINAGSALVSGKVYDALMKMGVSFNSGNMNVLDITGEIVELPGNTAVNASMSYEGRYLLCDGNLIIEDAKGLDGITGLYAKTLFYSDAIDLSGVKGITAARAVYPDGAKLRIGDTALGDDAHILFEDDALYWTHGKLTALNEVAAEKLREKKTSFHCKRLIIYNGLYERYRDMFKAESYLLIPDGHAVVEDITLDAATAPLYGGKLFVLGDMMIPHDQIQHLSGFSSLIVNGAVTMPVSAAAAFKAVGKANEFNLYEGVFMTVNGNQSMGHEQLQSALRRGISYTIEVNGNLDFLTDVTAEDIDAIAAIHCNGNIKAPGAARGALDSKIRAMNGNIYGYEEEENDEDEGLERINAGTYRL
ncbi:MAG: hypothetical protein LBI19_07680 [Oscillospiraceae bacterium]|jgi:hypothetical protein|nr:hypothetical protein [Oscillospiraceae bacterium]